MLGGSQKSCVDSVRGVCWRAFGPRPQSWSLYKRGPRLTVQPLRLSLPVCRSETGATVSPAGELDLSHSGTFRVDTGTLQCVESVFVVKAHSAHSCQILLQLPWV